MKTMSKPRPFPALTGGCFCGSTRYRLETAPLFCYACHCSDCHRSAGSIFACFTSIEADRVSSIGESAPKILQSIRPNAITRHAASCRTCGTELWTSGANFPVTIDIKTGTLDHPELMEPDLHECIESKVPWVILPEGARTCKGPFDFRKYWPKSSLVRFAAAVNRMEEGRQAKMSAGIVRAEEDEEKETDKTPTAQTPDEKNEDLEDDEEFERKFRETERVLLERLEQLSLRLGEQDKVAAAYAPTSVGENMKVDNSSATDGSKVKAGDLPTAGGGSDGALKTSGS